VNRKHLAEVADARKVAAAALDPKYAPGLAGVDFDATLPPQATALASQIEAGLGQLKGTRATRKVMTAQEKAARAALIAVIAPIQTAAKRKFSGDTQKQREAYNIGAGLASDTLEEVQNAARAILARLSPGENNAPPVDVLPGIKADKQIKALADAIAAYGSKDDALHDKQKEASGTLEDIQAAVDKLAGLRHQIQLAADQAWPWRTPKVATIRKAFLLPTDRPLPQ
jgi:hypothetical protein